MGWEQDMHKPAVHLHHKQTYYSFSNLFHIIHVTDGSQWSQMQGRPKEVRKMNMDILKSVHHCSSNWAYKTQNQHNITTMWLFF